MVAVARTEFGARGVACGPGAAVSGDVPDALEALMGDAV